VIVMHAPLGGVAGEDEILAIVIRDHDLLMAIAEGVEAAVGVFFLLAEPDEVELVAIREVVAKEAHAAVDVAEDEAAEVADERLAARANGQKIIVGRQVGDLVFGEPLLQREERAIADGAAPDIGADDAELVDLQRVDVERRRQLDAPVDRTERGIALEE